MFAWVGAFFHSRIITHSLFASAKLGKFNVDYIKFSQVAQLPRTKELLSEHNAASWQLSQCRFLSRGKSRPSTSASIYRQWPNVPQSDPTNIPAQCLGSVDGPTASRATRTRDISIGSTVLHPFNYSDTRIDNDSVSSRTTGPPHDQVLRYFSSESKSMAITDAITEPFTIHPGDTCIGGGHAIPESLTSVRDQWHGTEQSRFT